MASQPVPQRAQHIAPHCPPDHPTQLTFQRNALVLCDSSAKRSSSAQRRKSAVQRYLDAIGIDPSIPPRLCRFGLLEVLPIGEKRLAQLTGELTSASPELTPTPEQYWLYRLALQLTQQKITYENLCWPRVKKLPADVNTQGTKRTKSHSENVNIRQTYPSLLDSMRALTTEQTQNSLQQLTAMLKPAEFTILLRLYRDHVSREAIATDLDVCTATVTVYKKQALAKLRQNWHDLEQIFSIDPRLSEAIKT